MDISLVPQIAQWTTDQLSAFWATPTGNVALGITASGIYDLLKRFFKKPAATGALEEVRADPRDADNLRALNLQIVKHLKEDPAFGDELFKLLPPDFTQSIIQKQKIGDNSVGTQISGDQNRINIMR